MSGPPRLSICVALKNRSRVSVGGEVLELFPACVGALRNAVEQVDLVAELVVADFGSTDWPLDRWLAAAWGGPLVVVGASGAFSRGGGLNRAAAAATGTLLFFLDADMLVSPSVLLRAVEVSESGAIYFPTCWSFSNPLHTEGWRRVKGWGNCAMARTTFQRIGSWKERTAWGGEDDNLVRRIYRLKVPIIREDADLFHQWHPNDTAWKEQFCAAPVAPKVVSTKKKRWVRVGRRWRYR